MNEKRLYEKLEDYKKATARLNEATKIDVDHDIVIDGVIQRFEFTFESSWKLMETFLEFTGISDIKSPRGAIRKACAYGLINDGETWIDMLSGRNKTSYIFDESEAQLIYERITKTYNPLLQFFGQTIAKEVKDLHQHSLNKN